MTKRFTVDFEDPDEAESFIDEIEQELLELKELLGDLQTPDIISAVDKKLESILKAIY